MLFVCRALARNCNAPIDKKKGGEAKDWRGGKAVRVVRNFKGSAHSKYAPEEGNRYDGIYKVGTRTLCCSVDKVTLTVDVQNNTIRKV